VLKIKKMQVPVMGFRYVTKKPLAFATLDPEDVAAMEKFAQKKLVLRFGRTGEVQVNICYVEFLLENLRFSKKQYSPLLNYLFGRLPFMRLRKNYIEYFRDGNIMNMSKSNIINGE
jgi:hypothetical protein